MASSSKSSIAKSPLQFEFYFPEEVWEIILNMLEEDTDRTNCCRAFPIFDQILTSSNPVWLFKQILPLMCYRWGDIGSALTCRGVCKQWSADIDHRIFTNPYYWYDEDKMQSCYIFDCMEKIESFTQTFEGHSRSPFIGRRVGIEKYLDETNFEVPPKFLELLSNLGEHAWILKQPKKWREWPCKQ